MFNYRHPGPRREEPQVRAASREQFWVDPLDPVDLVDPLENYGSIPGASFLCAGYALEPLCLGNVSENRGG